ncbi:hypothetical protein A2Z00_01185 [Candidatus Gottesmanbacteria bacterium RBG_13_45_10]|uniref:CAAX prenyl protease 2/Lysostaphin resistance protein A-like domain-containing protein n=1 Tax=Candidatus Gottesmanbacteria bacterium RBG_13_45_10 TaxID=1798370 RepID=A0A1F5ZGU0_9BACT|nr:MAG: hypothetical protein A2Z00_01185 [Candidatus Gottesmanbacteria bacterium RBG_13_45_10]
MPAPKKKSTNPFLVFLVIFVLWTVYRYFFQLPDWVDEFFVKPVLQLLPVVLVVGFVERKSAQSLGIQTKNIGFQVAIGVLAGVLIVGEALVTRRWMNPQLTFNPGHLGILLIARAALVSLATGFTEETIYRGYFMNRFMKRWHMVVATGMNSVLFTVVHLPIVIFSLHYGLHDAFTYSLQVFVLGLVFGFMFAKTKSIVPSMISHAMWNFTNVLF